MFIPKKVVEWFTELKEDSRTQAEIANTALGHLREELTRLHADVQAKSRVYPGFPKTTGLMP